MNISLYFSKQTCYLHNNNGILYLHLCSKTNSAELSLRFVLLINSTQIFCEHVISRLSLRFVSNHQPRLSFYRLIKVMPKLMKFKGQRSQDKIHHIWIFWQRTECAFLPSVRKGQFCLWNLCGFMFHWINVAVRQFIHRADPVRWPLGDYLYHPGPFRGLHRRRKAAGQHPWIPYGSRYIYWLKSAKEIARCPGGPLMQPARFFKDCLQATGLNKTLGELGAAFLTQPAPVRVVKIVPAPAKSEGSRPGTVRNDQYIYFYSPYGAWEWFVKAP